MATRTQMPDGAPASQALASLQELIQGGRPLIYIYSSEESRVQHLLKSASLSLFSNPPPVLNWSSTAPLHHPDGGAASATPLDAYGVLQFIADHEGAGIFQLKDFHEFMRSEPAIRRRLRDLYALCTNTDRFLVITSAGR